MSFAGAVRMCLVGWQAPPWSPPPEGATLPPIANGRFAAWADGGRAAAGPTIAEVPPPTDARCRLPDGSIGRVALVREASGVTAVCQVATLQKVRR